MFGENNNKYLFFKVLDSIFGKTYEKTKKEGGINEAQKYKNLAQKRTNFRSCTKQNIAKPKDHSAKLNTKILNIFITDLFEALIKIKIPNDRNRNEQINNKIVMKFIFNQRQV